MVWEGLRYPPKVVIAKALEIEYGREFTTKGFSGGESAANAALRKLTFTIVAKDGPTGRLPLILHHRYGRPQAYGCFGLHYDQQQRHLNLGLSPRLSDDGYYIFTTLDKEGLDPAHDYEDELFAEQFVWVTRRGVTKEDADYVNLRQDDCRVSLFVRNNSREQFVYAGELDYTDQTQLVDPITGKSQLKIVWRLQHPLPDSLLEELTFGSRSASGKRNKPQSKQPARHARPPSTFDELKRAYTYALGTASDRLVIPEHYNYQVRLKKFLSAHGVVAEMERDFIDVAFTLSDSYIGEIKVTRNLTIAQAFRTAFGQVVEYRFLRSTNNPNMIIFLDQQLDAQRTKIASVHQISVVAQVGEEFLLLNPEIATAELADLFGHGKTIFTS